MMRLGNVEPNREPTDAEYEALKLVHTAFAEAVYDMRNQVQSQLAEQLGLPVEQVVQMWRASGCT